MAKESSEQIPGGLAIVRPPYGVVEIRPPVQRESAVVLNVRDRPGVRRLVLSCGY
jgi:hypothetical protein